MVCEDVYMHVDMTEYQNKPSELSERLISDGLSTGPDKWAKDFPVANGPRQSPINIVPQETQYAPSLRPLKLRYDPSNSKGILNNGHSFQVDFVDDDDSSSKTFF